MDIKNLDISPDYVTTSEQEVKLFNKLLKLEGTPKAIRHFDKVHKKLGNYCYWFGLSTLWVSYAGFSDIKMWRKLFMSNRPMRATSIMKPSELKVFNELPDELLIYRAKRENEQDWLAYTLSADIAARMALHRGVRKIHVYHVSKTDILALFLRRGEQEVIILDCNIPKLIDVLDVIRVEDNK